MNNTDFEHEDIDAQQPINIHMRFMERRNRMIGYVLKQKGYNIQPDFIPSTIRDLIFEGRIEHDAVQRYLARYGNVDYSAGNMRSSVHVDDKIDDIDNSLCIKLKNKMTQETFQVFRRRYKDKNPLASKILMRCRIHNNMIVCPDIEAKRQVESYFVEKIDGINREVIYRL